MNPTVNLTLPLVATAVLAAFVVCPGQTGMTFVANPALIFAVPEIARPAYLEPATDPTFGTRIVRIAGDTDEPIAWVDAPVEGGTWSAVSRHHYIHDSPWNSDGSLIWLENHHNATNDVILDGESYQPKLARPKNYKPRTDKWHPSPRHPNERIGISGRTLEWFDVVGGVQTRSWLLPFDVTHELQMNPSRDGRFVALFNEERMQMFVVDMDPQAPLAPYARGTQRIGLVADIPPCVLKKEDGSECHVSWVAVSPSARFVVVHYSGDHLRVFDLEPATLEISLRPMPADISLRPGLDPNDGYITGVGHSDMTLNPFDGNEDVSNWALHAAGAKVSKDDIKSYVIDTRKK